MTQNTPDEADILSQLDNLRSENLDLKNKIKDFEKLKDDGEAADELLGDAEKRLVSLETKTKELQTQLQSAETDKAALQSTVNSLKAANDKLTTEMSDFQGRVAKDLAKYGIRRESLNTPGKEEGDQSDVPGTPKEITNYTEAVKAHKAGQV